MCVPQLHHNADGENRNAAGSKARAACQARKGVGARLARPVHVVLRDQRERLDIQERRAELDSPRWGLWVRSGHLDRRARRVTLGYQETLGKTDSRATWESRVQRDQLVRQVSAACKVSRGSQGRKG